MSSAKPYEGLVAVVTGAASGMGLGLCHNLTAKGAKVVGCDMNEAAGIEKMKEIGATFVKADVTNWESIQNVFNVAVKQHGTVDLVFPNAGVATAGYPRPITEKDFSKPPSLIDVAVDLNGVAYTVQAALDVIRHKPDPASLPASEPAFRRKWRGKIVVTASQASLYTFPASPLYNAAKHGAWGLVKSLALNLDPAERITINCVGPALVATAMFSLFPQVLKDVQQEDNDTPISTIMRAFDEFLPTDVETNGAINEAHRKDTIIREPLPYMSENIKNVYHNHFFPPHAVARDPAKIL